MSLSKPVLFSNSQYGNPSLSWMCKRSTSVRLRW
uniref:LRR-RLK n=1 Tax=Rhizophora mucronata TaxID=61149 RepID=A0A2P2MWR2_RHIMU